MKQNTKTIDPLTGGDYETELAVYVRYHGLSREVAEKIMAVTSSYLDRDVAFQVALSELS